MPDLILSEDAQKAISLLTNTEDLLSDLYLLFFTQALCSYNCHTYSVMFLLKNNLNSLGPSLRLFWLVGCFGLNGPLRQCFSLYRAVSQREGERKEK